jgi:hypothetical protein
VVALSCLQLASFAIYATILLYYMNPGVDLRGKPDFVWATRITQRWKQSRREGGAPPLLFFFFSELQHADFPFPFVELGFGLTRVFLEGSLCYRWMYKERSICNYVPSQFCAVGQRNSFPRG